MSTELLLVLALLGPVALRVVFELLLLTLSIRDELAEAGDLLRRMQGSVEIFAR